MDGLFDTLGTGGPIVALLMGLSVISVAVIVYKLIQLWPVLGGASRRAEAFRAWASGDKSGATGQLKSGKAPADRVSAYAAEALQQGLSGPRLDNELVRRGNEELAAMSSYIRILELIAMISPLLGLLGTVLGMIQSFQELELAEGAANASVLAGGIWQALLTTAAGLIVAIPAAIAATLFSARIDLAGQRIEGAVGQLMLAEDSAT